MDLKFAHGAPQSSCDISVPSLYCEQNRRQVTRHQIALYGRNVITFTSYGINVRNGDEEWKWYHILIMVCAEYILDPMRLSAAVRGLQRHKVTTERDAKMDITFGFCD